MRMIVISEPEARPSKVARGEIERLEEMAREEIREAQDPVPRRRAFLIFRVGDTDQVQAFCSLAKEADPHLDFIDFALKVHFKTENAEYVRHCIKRRIEACSAVILFIGKTTHDCEWVDWEVREGLRMKKPLIAVRLNDKPSLRVPKVLKEHRINPLPCSNDEIRQMIRNNAEIL
jgi:hypothetical protein